MSVIEYAGAGRGAWPDGGYKAPSDGGTQPGIEAVRALARGAAVPINAYAVHRAVAAIQQVIGMPAESWDGMLGPRTGAAITAWQASKSLSADGSFGPRSARRAFEPAARAAVERMPSPHRSALALVVLGLVTMESAWDPGAVGVSDSTDLGLGQINGVHRLPESQRLDPRQALAWMAEFCQGNLAEMDGNVRDAIAAYNLGVAGARRWINAGRPDVWHLGAKQMNRYIDRVLAAGA